MYTGPNAETRDTRNTHRHSRSGKTQCKTPHRRAPPAPPGPRRSEPLLSPVSTADSGFESHISYNDISYVTYASRIRMCASMDRHTISITTCNLWAKHITHVWITQARTDSKHQARRSGREGYRAASLPCALHIETVTLPRCIQIVDPDPAAFTTPLYKADPQYQRPLHPPPRRRSAFAALAKRVSAFAAPTLAPWALPCASRRRGLPGRT